MYKEWVLSIFVAGLTLALALCTTSCNDGPSLPEATPGGGWILETWIYDYGVLASSLT
jgi:hypothetical protein